MIPAEAITVEHGDSREVLRMFDGESFDAVVCDPPYALVSITKRFGADNAAPALSNGATGVYARASSGFMGQKWDTGATAFDPEFWREVWRVLKPGGHVVAFGGTRTYHRMASAIEDAGFDIRDMLQWLYGSGFPKSHDVGKGIDRKRNDRAAWEAVGRWLRAQREARGLLGRDVASLWPSKTGGLTGCVANWELGFNLPKWEQWLTLKAFIGFTDEMDAAVWRLNGRKGTPGDAWQKREVVATISGTRLAVAPGQDNDRSPIELTRTAGAQFDSQLWDGWGTALKPACEPIVLARKPLIGTVVDNVLTHGTGALNIDACRVEWLGPEDAAAAAAAAGFADARRRGTARQSDSIGKESRDGTNRYDPNALTGRWPANVVHDGSDEVVEHFPQSEGMQGGDLSGHEPNASHKYLARPNGNAREPFPARLDSGSAARFFYTAKADSNDRLGSKHPTVKPVDLMQWLVRLVTPKGGLILDPFAGSGSTGEAAWREGMRCVLIEREAKFVADIRRRIGLLDASDRERGVAVIKGRGLVQGPGPLFGYGESQ